MSAHFEQDMGQAYILSNYNDNDNDSKPHNTLHSRRLSSPGLPSSYSTSAPDLTTLQWLLQLVRAGSG